MRALNTQITGELKNSDQMRGIAHARRFTRVDDDDVDAYVAFSSTLGLPLGDRPLSLDVFIKFEDYLSGFYGERIRMMREYYKGQVEFYKELYNNKINEHKNRETGSDGNKRAAKTNRRSTGSNARSNRSAKTVGSTRRKR